MIIQKDTDWKPVPSAKSPAIDALITSIFGVDRKASVENKTCAICDASVELNSFKNEISLKEFHISGLCQDCQDEVFG